MELKVEPISFEEDSSSLGQERIRISDIDGGMLEVKTELPLSSLFEDLEFENFTDVNDVPMNTKACTEPGTFDLPAPPIIEEFFSRSSNDTGTLVGKMMQRLNNILVTSDPKAKELEEAQPEIASCQICAVKLNNRSIMFDHLKLLHKIKLPDFDYKGEGAVIVCEEQDEGDTTFTCNLCDAKFKARIKIENHVINHYTECLFCDVCSDYFQNLNEHKRIVHRGVDPHICPDCKRSFMVDSRLYRHLRDIHGREFFMKCTSCNRGFVDAYTYLTEGQLHCGFNFYCVVCHKKTNSYQKLFSHQIHTHVPTTDFVDDD